MFLTRNISYNQTQATIAVTYWVIAGGGGAGRDDFFGTRMGGGGAGGILTSTVNIPVNETLTATSIGAGGSYQSSSSTSGNVGNNSVLTSTTLGTITAFGGGQGAGTGGGTNVNGGTGGSGGGGVNSGSGGLGTSGQGNNGAAGDGNQDSGGGGGHSAAANDNNGGAGTNIIYAKTASNLATEMFAYGGGSRSGSAPYSAGTNGDGTAADTGRNTTAGVSGEPYRGSGGRWQGGGGNSGSILIRIPVSHTGYSKSTSYPDATDSNYRYFTLQSTGHSLTL
tara:strand:+ start:693 stop:1532 length:840 start_codon:yes stop_codon:yes gene_type:complete